MFSDLVLPAFVKVLAPLQCEGIVLNCLEISGFSVKQDYVYCFSLAPFPFVNIKVGNLSWISVILQNKRKQGKQRKETKGTKDSRVKT